MKGCAAQVTLPSRRRGETGASLLVLIGALGVLAILAGALVPEGVRSLTEAAAQDEGRKLDDLGKALLTSIKRTQVIPGANNWVAAVAAELQMNAVDVRQVFPQFPNETTTRRVYLIDPAFTPATGVGLLPYTQTAGGIDPASPNAPGVNSRVMIVSSSHRSLSIPVGDGILTPAMFSNLWEWSYDPATAAPPPGFPASWSGQARHLHVKRLSLADRFHRVSLKTVTYSINGSAPPTSVSTQIQRCFLRGGLLKVYRTNGTLHASRVINRDAQFDLTPVSASTPLEPPPVSPIF